MSVLPVVTVAVMVMVRAVFVAVLLVAAMATITMARVVLIPMISKAVVVVVVVVPFILVGPRAIWRHKLPRGIDRGRGIGNPRAGPRLRLSHLSLHG
jgi:hypothetical protein